MEQTSAFSSKSPLRILGLVVLGAFCHVEVCRASADALADYVALSDKSYSWKKDTECEIGEVTAIKIGCTSQTWRGHIWQHQMLIVRPREIRNKDIALLFITGDGNVDDHFRS